MPVLVRALADESTHANTVCKYIMLNSSFTTKTDGLLGLMGTCRREGRCTDSQPHRLEFGGGDGVVSGNASVR